MFARWAVLLSCVLIAAPIASACVDEATGIRLASLDLNGVDRVDEHALRAALATKTGGRWPWSPKTYFNEDAFRQDLDRIRVFYVDRGYPDARIESVETTFSEDRRSVAVRIAVVEGAPLLIDSVAVEGFDVLDEGARERLSTGTVDAGSTHDRAAILAVRQAGLDLLRDSGFAYATVDVHEERVAPGRVGLTFRADPGPPAVFGPITIDGLTNLTDRVVRRQLSIRPGEPYSARRVTVSQRRLTTVELLQFASVDASPPESRPHEIPVRVTVAEDRLRRLQMGVGYGTEEKARGTIEWAHLNFLGDARRVAVAARWSSIERGVQTNFREPYFLRQGLSLEGGAQSRWNGERIYTASNYGGRLGVAYRFSNRIRGAGRGLGDRLAASYVYEYLRHDIRPDVKLELTHPEELIALGLDPVTGHGRGTRAGLVLEYERVIVDNVANPRAGYSLATHVEVAGPRFGGTYRYNETRAEARAYVPAGPTVVAARLSAGVIDARTQADVPISQRYFLGGASSLRGWGRYQVAPLVDGVPVGGLRMAEATVELRMPVRPSLGVVTFIDSGVVGSAGRANSTGRLSDVGAGVRYVTPIGLLRGDIGVQLGPLEGLDPTRQSEARRWRIHIGIGHAF